MPVNAKIGDRYVNPLNVTVTENTLIKRNVTEETSGNKEVTSDDITAVRINTTGTDEIIIEGVPIEDVVEALDKSLNMHPIINPNQ